MADPTLTLSRLYSPTYVARIGYTLPSLSDTDSPYPVISGVDGAYPASTPAWPTCTIIDETSSPTGTQVYFNTADGKRAYYFNDGTKATAELMIYEGMTLAYSSSSVTNYANWDAYNSAVGQTLYVDLPAYLLKSNTTYSFSLRVTIASSHRWEYWQEQTGRWDHWECPNYVTQSQVSGWGSLDSVVNAAPVVSEMYTNGQTNPKLPNASSITFEFRIDDDDGPSMRYRAQAGTVSPAFDIEWDTQLIDVGRVVGGREFSISYSEVDPDAVRDVVTNVQYAWRVMSDDGYPYGDGTTPWSSLNYFRLNGLPYVISLKMGGLELLGGVEQKISSHDVLVEWDYVDPEGAVQTSYRLVLNPRAGGSATTYEASGAASSFTIPLIAPGIYDVSMSVKDDIEYGNAVTGIILVNAKPSAVSLKIDGEINPASVTSSNPSIEWTFHDDDSADSQQSYRVQVATDSAFKNLVWDTGSVLGASDNIAYGTVVPSPIVTPVALTHQMYYFRVSVYDGVSWSTWDSYGSFYFNNPPGDPTLTSPTSGLFSESIDVAWVGATPLDLDGDEVTYVVEMTDDLSNDSGWNQIAGPLPSTTTSYSINLSSVPAGENYGVRVIASDGITSSDPSNGGTSPLFSIANHAPVTPIITSPVAGSTQAMRIVVEWQEADTVDVDDDAVIYKVWLTQDGGTTWDLVDTIPSGNSRTVIDATLLSGGTCNVRIMAVDEHGAEGEYKYSGEFQLDNSSAATDFETLNGVTYVSTIDGKLRKSIGRNWTLDQTFAYGPPTEFEVFAAGAPSVTVKNGQLVIAPKPGGTFMLRQAKD
jgi:hypothetical protein